jgi:class 3 adenylate cyclase
VAVPETLYATSGDVHLAYQVTGDGPVDLLMPSYLMVSIDSFEDEPRFARFLDRLGSFARVIRYDRRGIGLSDPISPSAPPTVEQEVEDALAVLDAAGVERAALFGAGPSGLSAILAAATHPARVDALVLFNSYARLERAPDYPVGVPAAILQRFVEDVTSTDPSGDVTQSLRVGVPSVADDVEFARWWDHAGRRGASPATARALDSVAFHADLRVVLPSITVPTLVLHRRECEWMRVGLGRYLAEHIAGAHYVELDGADTTPFTGNSEQVLDEIEEFLTGERRYHDRDRVLATILFTDIVRSTERAADLGDTSWRELLDRHDAMVRRQVHRFAGREVKTTGDGVLVSFDGPARAIRCATAIRDGAHQLGITIRSGVHTGEVELRGDDLAGIAVHVGQRISGLAGPGEVLVSRTVRDLVAGSGIELEDRGVHTLRGIAEPWQVFAVA